MDFRMLLLAHDAFYKYEPRAKQYDTFMVRKSAELWSKPELSDAEIENLLGFVRKWDRFFTGDTDLFREAYSDNYKEISKLYETTFFEIDLEDNNNQNCLLSVFDAFAICNHSGKYESTDASKLVHAMNPDVFVMWDSNIRENYLGSQEDKYARNYVYEFLPHMKKELLELVGTCTFDCSLSETEALFLLEKISGNTVPKLIDQFNYMNYTMRTMFGAYLGNLSDKEKEKMQAPFGESIQYWTNRVPRRNHQDREKTRQFTEMVSSLRKRGVITDIELRDYNEKWKKLPEDRDYWFDLVESILREKTN